MSSRKPIKYISLFSGIEAASVAWEPLGWQPVLFCEIDAFPSAVLAERYPNVPNLGDITQVDWSPYVGAADVVVGGSPCQSFSYAGKREGLKGASGLMFEYIRAVRELRPKWFVWENVQGALSSEDGDAFRQLLSEMDALGYGLAWRVLDAQFFGVPQRRERVFLVGSLGTQRAAEVLFEPDSMSWDHPSSREKRQALASGIVGGVGEADSTHGGGDCLNVDESQSRRVYRSEGVAPTLSARTGRGQNQQAVLTESIRGEETIGFAQNQRGEVRRMAVSGALAAQPGMKQQTFVDQTQCKGHCRQDVITVRVAQTASNGNPISRDNIANTLDCTNSTAVCTPMVCRADLQVNAMEGIELAPTLTSHAKKDPPVVYPKTPYTFLVRCGKSKGGGKGLLIQENMSATLTTHNMQVLAEYRQQSSDKR